MGDFKRGDTCVYDDRLRVVTERRPRDENQQKPRMIQREKERVEEIRNGECRSQEIVIRK